MLLKKYKPKHTYLTIFVIANKLCLVKDFLTNVKYGVNFGLTPHIMNTFYQTQNLKNKALKCSSIMKKQNEKSTP